ncbi:MAG: tRNA pseudouridine(13) synthase TruD [Phycisphaerales bacterium]
MSEQPLPSRPSLPRPTSAFARESFPPRAHPDQYLTAGLPGIGGEIKVRAADFVVEEIPAYQPSGEGEHLALFIEKAGLSTLQMVAILARHYRVGQGAIGYAGLKDKHAVTRQWVTVHLPGAAKQVPELPWHGKLSVLQATRHGNKLRRGHLRGNRFEIRVRDMIAPTDESAARARATMTALAATGMPNRFGEQRFGHAQNNHRVGRALVAGDAALAVWELLLAPEDASPEHQPIRALIERGEFAEAANLLPEGAEAEIRVLHGLAVGRTPRAAFKGVSYVARSFYLSALQSAIFNGVLDRRLRDGTWDRIVEGDLAFKHGNGAVFSVDAATASDPVTLERLSAGEISASGPMWGLRMPTASGAIGALEVEHLAAAGLSPGSFEAFRQEWGEELAGDRRPLKVALAGAHVEAGADDHGPYVLCRFELPAGSFATAVMDEVMKTRAVRPDPSA